MHSETTSPNSDSLDQTLADLRCTPIPEPPPAELFLARLPIVSSTSIAASVGRPRSARTSNGLRRSLRYTSAAIALSMLVGWLVLSWPRGDVLAQAIAATEKSDIARCKFVTTAHSDVVVGGLAQSTETIYFDLKAPRWRIEMQNAWIMNSGSQKWVTVQDNRADRILTTSDVELTIDESTADEKLRQLINDAKSKGLLGKRAKLGRITGQGMFPFTHAKTDKSFLDMLRDFQNRKNVASVQDTLDGRSTMKYRLEEPDRASTLWIDLETKRPVRIEEERPNKGQKLTDYKWTLSEFEWDVKDLTGQLFSVRPPAGYTLEDRTAEEN